MTPKLGPVVSASQLEEQVRDVLQMWLHSYLGELEERVGRAVGSMPRPRSWTRTSGPAAGIHDRQIPRVIIRSPGPASIERHGTQFSGWFVVGVAVIVRGRDEDETRALAQDYTAALRLLLTQVLPDVAADVQLDAEGYEVLDSNRERTHAGGELVVEYAIDGLADVDAGPGPEDTPTQPPDPPPVFGEWTVVDEVFVDVVGQSPGG